MKGKIYFDKIYSESDTLQVRSYGTVVKEYNKQDFGGSWEGLVNKKQDFSEWDGADFDKIKVVGAEAHDITCLDEKTKNTWFENSRNLIDERFFSNTERRADIDTRKPIKIRNTLQNKEDFDEFIELIQKIINTNLHGISLLDLSEFTIYKRASENPLFASEANSIISSVQVAPRISKEITNINILFLNFYNLKDVSFLDVSNVVSAKSAFQNTAVVDLSNLEFHNLENVYFLTSNPLKRPPKILKAKNNSNNEAFFYLKNREAIIEDCYFEYPNIHFAWPSAGGYAIDYIKNSTFVDTSTENNNIASTIQSDSIENFKLINCDNLTIWSSKINGLFLDGGKFTINGANISGSYLKDLSIDTCTKKLSISGFDTIDPIYIKNFKDSSNIQVFNVKNIKAFPAALVGELHQRDETKPRGYFEFSFSFPASDGIMWWLDYCGYKKYDSSSTYYDAEIKTSSSKKIDQEKIGQITTSYINLVDHVDTLFNTHKYIWRKPLSEILTAKEEYPYEFKFNKLLDSTEIDCGFYKNVKSNIENANAYVDGDDLVVEIDCVNIEDNSTSTGKLVVFGLDYEAEIDGHLFNGRTGFILDINLDFIINEVANANFEIDETTTDETTTDETTTDETTTDETTTDKTTTDETTTDETTTDETTTDKTTTDKTTTDETTTDETTTDKTTTDETTTDGVASND